MKTILIASFTTAIVIFAIIASFERESTPIVESSKESGNIVTQQLQNEAIPATTIDASTTLLTINNNFEDVVMPPQTDDDEKVTNTVRSTVERLNLDLIRRTDNVRLYASIDTGDRVQKFGDSVPVFKTVRVENPNSWPEETSTSYVILLNDAGNVVAFVMSYGSEDALYSFTHYYDEAGSTIAFQRMLRFISAANADSEGGQCEAWMNETRTQYFLDRRVIAKEYMLTGENDKRYSPGPCSFGYPIDHPILATWLESKNAAGINDDL